MVLPSHHRPSVDVIAGCLLGGAIGDALGYPVEFVFPASSIIRLHGAEPPRVLNYAGGALALISDDTQMTLFTAEGLLEALREGTPLGAAKPHLARAYLRWFHTQMRDELLERGLASDRRLFARRAPGNTCMSALAALERRGEAELPSRGAPVNDSKGCGAVMRVAPVGLAAPSREDAYAAGGEAGLITHGHPSGYLAAAYFAALIWGVAQGETLERALDEADLLLGRERHGEEVRALLRRARDAARHGTPSVGGVEALGGGWTGEESLAIAALCALTANVDAPGGIERALWTSVAHAGDSDSTGSLTGNLLGALVGAKRLPAAWLERLELRDVVERLARELHAAQDVARTPPARPDERIK